MKKRPLSIVIIAIIYFFEPIGNLIQAAYINGLPLIGKDSIVGHLVWSDWIILRCQNIEISLLGRVIRKTAEKGAAGYGILFQSMSKDTRHKIKCLIRKLEELGGRDRKGSILESRLPVDFIRKKMGLRPSWL